MQNKSLNISTMTTAVLLENKYSSLVLTYLIKTNLAALFTQSSTRESLLAEVSHFWACVFCICLSQVKHWQIMPSCCLCSQSEKKNDGTMTKHSEICPFQGNSFLLEAAHTSQKITEQCLVFLYKFLFVSEWYMGDYCALATWVNKIVIMFWCLHDQDSTLNDNR